MSHNRYHGTGIPQKNALDVIASWREARNKGYKNPPSARQLWWVIANTMLTPQLCRIVYFNVTRKSYGEFTGANARNAIFHGVVRYLQREGKDMDEFVLNTLTRILENAQRPKAIPATSSQVAPSYANC